LHRTEGKKRGLRTATRLEWQSGKACPDWARGWNGGDQEEEALGRGRRKSAKKKKTMETAWSHNDSRRP